MKPILLSALLLILTGCEPHNGDNPALCRQAVCDELKTRDVQQFPGEKWKWIARTPNGEIWYAETLGQDTKITAKTILFNGVPEEH